MATKRVYVIECNNAEIEEFRDLLEGDSRFNIVGGTTNAIEGIEYLRNNPIDCLVLNLVLNMTDGFFVLDKIKEYGLKLSIVVVSSFVNDKMVGKAMEKGADYYIAKPYEKELLIGRLGNLLLSESDKITVRENNVLEERITNVFLMVGIPPHIKGYQYLREGVKMAIEKPEVINNITKKLYPQIGVKCQTSPSKVERAIRHAIEVAWNRGRLDNINSIFGVRAYNQNEKPTNGEFIALIADKMILEMKNKRF